MRKRQTSLIAGVFLIISCPLNAGERLTLGVSPPVAFAPATVMVRATVEANPDNRAIQIVAESQDFYRSSEIPLDGDRAPRTSVVEYKACRVAPIPSPPC